jgi:hypothetical protein
MKTLKRLRVAKSAAMTDQAIQQTILDELRSPARLVRGPCRGHSATTLHARESPALVCRYVRG